MVVLGPLVPAARRLYSVHTSKFVSVFCPRGDRPHWRGRPVGLVVWGEEQEEDEKATKKKKNKTTTTRRREEGGGGRRSGPTENIYKKNF